MEINSKTNFKYAWGMVRKEHNQNKRRLKRKHSPEVFYHRAEQCHYLRCEAAETIRCYEDSSLYYEKAKKEGNKEKMLFHAADILYCQTHWF